MDRLESENDPFRKALRSTVKSKKLWLILGVSFILGVAVTVAEPDLQILAETVPHIDTAVSRQTAHRISITITK